MLDGVKGFSVGLDCGTRIMLCYSSTYWSEVNPQVLTGCLEFNLKYSGNNEQTIRWGAWRGRLDETTVVPGDRG